MKLSSVSIPFSALVALSNAQDPPMLRGLGHGGGHRGGHGGGHDKGGGGGGGHGKGGHGKGENGSIYSMMNGNCYWGADDSKPLLDQLQEECKSKYYCVEGLNCVDPQWKTMDGDRLIVDGCPEGGLTDVQKKELKDKMQAKHDEMEDMTTYEERKAHREERNANKAANAATVLGCGCCSGDSGIESVTTLVKGKEGAVARTLDFRKPRVDGEGGGHGFGGDGSGSHGLEWTLRACWLQSALILKQKRDVPIWKLKQKEMSIIVASLIQ